MTHQPPFSGRAGYWRRAIGVVLDWLIVGVPFSIVAALVFSASGGTWQSGSVLVNITRCVGIRQIPQDLAPAPPKDSNFARICTISSGFGQTAHTLIVGRTDTSPGRSSTVSRNYSLDGAGRVTDVHDITWAFYLLMLVYVVGLQHSSGQTLGQRVTRIRLIEALDPARHGVGFGRLAKRYGLLLGVYLLPVPFLFVAINAAASAEGESSGWILVMATAALIWSVWSMWNLVLIIRRRPAVYDRVAGLEVVRITRPAGSPHPV